MTKPIIEELEAIMENAEGAEVKLHPDGRVTVEENATVVALRTQLKEQAAEIEKVHDVIFDVLTCEMCWECRTHNSAMKDCTTRTDEESEDA
jgi:hypothetical protein